MKHVGRIFRVTNGTAKSSIVIELNSEGSELYALNDEKSISPVENKYGKPPALPSSPVRNDDNFYITSLKLAFTIIQSTVRMKPNN
ncbi:hypothetical protein GCM10027443_33050 [Pontibacter brevis]